MSDDRDKLITDNIGRAHFIAKKYGCANGIPTGLNISDLVGVGTIGLISAVDKYDPESEVPFGTYANKIIRWHIMNFCAYHYRHNGGSKISDTDVYEYSISDYRLGENDVCEYDYMDTLNCLSERSRQIMKMRFIYGMTGEKIAQEFNITRQRVFQIIESSLETLRAKL